MQFIRASRDAILKPLSTVAGIVERRHTLPILANVLLRKEGDSVSFLATDVEIQIQTTASPSLRRSTLARIGRVCRRSTIPATVESGLRIASREALMNCICIYLLLVLFMYTRPGGG